MPMTILLIPLAMVMFVLAIVRFMRQRKAKRLDRQQTTACVSDFSASEYMGRMERLGIEIMEEAQRKPKYQLVLWLALDGLRLNEDGTSEWIRRGGEKKAEPAKYNTFADCTMQQTYNPAQNCAMQPKMQMLIFRQQQAMQNALLINTIRPQYPYYQPYYQQHLQQTCCYSPYNQCQSM